MRWQDSAEHTVGWQRCCCVCAGTIVDGACRLHTRVLRLAVKDLQSDSQAEAVKAVTRNQHTDLDVEPCLGAGLNEVDRQLPRLGVTLLQRHLPA